MDIKDYGYINGIAGVVSGITGTAFSILLTFCINRFEYYKTMSVFFIAGGVTLAVSAFFAITFKTTQTDVKFQKTEKVSIFRYKPFYFLLLPNILRGFSYGVLRLITIIGYHCKIIDASAAGILTTLLFLTTTIGSYTYSRLSVLGKNGSIILISSILLIFSMPAMVIWKQPLVFYVMFFVSQFVVVIINIAVPTAITEIVSYSYIGRYTAWCVILHTGGVFLAGLVITPMLNTCGAITALIIAAMAQLVSGCSILFIHENTHAYWQCLKNILFDNEHTKDYNVFVN